MPLDVPMLHFLLMMRLAAVGLLALMFVDLGMDLWQGERGDSNSDEANLSFFYTGQPDPSISTEPQQSGTEPFQHECFCCCSHIEQQGSIIVSVTLESSPSESDRTVVSSDPDLYPDYHPPQHTT